VGRIPTVADEAVRVEGKSDACVGKRLYHPGLLAAYTILLNAPVGLILYGLNIMARGNRLYGKIMIGSGILSGIGLLVILLNPYLARWADMLLLVDLICGISIYKFETGPYQRAIAAGALRARWWPPLLIVIGVFTALSLHDLARLLR
jgi:hypothetical protein